MTDVITEKRCARCAENKPVSEFGVAKARKGGLNVYCRPCCRSYKVAWYHGRDFSNRTSPEAKRCVGCRSELPASRFAGNVGSGDGLQTYCRDCTHWKTVARRYRVSRDAYLAALERQGGGCAICGARDNGRKAHFDVDHCHESGRFRGLLCWSCNAGIGKLGDSAERIERALTYLRAAT